MKLEEANRIIAEYMGYVWNNVLKCFLKKGGFRRMLPPSYTESLDALVPVWERLHDEKAIMSFYFNGYREWKTEFYRDSGMRKQLDIVEDSKSAQISASLATAKAILVLKETK